MWIGDGAPILNVGIFRTSKFLVLTCRRILHKGIPTKYYLQNGQRRTPPPTMQDSNLVVRELLEELETECARQSLDPRYKKLLANNFQYKTCS
jgi:hypothetical protein